MLKKIMVFMNIVIALFCYLFSRFDLEKRLNIIGIYFWDKIFIINMLFCIIGIILFIKYIIYEKNKYFSIKYLLLIPSVFNLIFFIYTIIIININDLYSINNYNIAGMTISAILFSIGLPLLLLNYINQNYKFIILLILCILLPVNIIYSYIEMWHIFIH